MSFFYIEPEVSGGLGPKTIMDTSVHPPVIDKLNYEFESWLGDDIIESFPCYLVTEKLSKQLLLNNFSGFLLDHVLVSTSEDFTELNEGESLPKFYWLKIKGIAMEDDFGLSADFRLVISQNILNILNLNKICNADIEIVTIGNESV